MLALLNKHSAFSHCLQFAEQQFPIHIDTSVAREVTKFFEKLVCEELSPILCDKRFMVDYFQRCTNLLQKTDNPDWDAIAEILDIASAFSGEVLREHGGKASLAFAVDAYKILMLKYTPMHKKVQKAVNRVVDGAMRCAEYDDADLYSSTNVEILPQSKDYDADDYMVAIMQVAHVTRTLVVLGRISGEESIAALKKAEKYAREVVEQRRIVYKKKSNVAATDLPNALQLLADILEMQCSKVDEEEEALNLNLEAVAIITALLPVGLESSHILARNAQYSYRRAERLRGEGKHEQSQRYFSTAIAGLKKAEQICRRNQSDTSAFQYRLLWLNYEKRGSARDYFFPGFNTPGVVEKVNIDFGGSDLMAVRMDYPGFI